MFIPRKVLEKKLLELLAEDVGFGDVTSFAVIPEGLQAKAEVVAKAEGIVAGIEESTVLVETVGLKCIPKVADGTKVKTENVLLQISGNARTLLTVERTLLNLLSRMSGIATATKSLVEQLKSASLDSKIAATRKCAPGLVFFDKKAVVIGGGDSHRLHLDDLVLIKDNHILLAGGLAEAVKTAKRFVSFSKKIEVEVTQVADVLQAAELGVDVVLMDNFSAEQVREAIALLKNAELLDKVRLEVSGGVTRENFLDFAGAGVDYISLGELTHSVKALDVSLEVRKRLD